MAKTARGDQRLGRAVFDRQVERIGVGMQDAGIGEKLHPCRFRRFDHGAMLRFALADFARRDERSEEHTSELQSLMRISYAVFCLKKKITTIYAPQTCEITNIWNAI